MTDERDHLDAWLDDLIADPAAVPPVGVDRDTAAAVRRLRLLSDATTAAHLTSDRHDKRWEDLMRNSTSPDPGLTQSLTLRPSPNGPIPLGLRQRAPAGWRGEDGASPIATAVVPVRGPSVLRRAGSRTLGLVATLTLVLLVGLSGFAVYLSAPRDGDQSTQVGSGLSSTPATEEAEQQPGIVIGVQATTCLAPPADFDDTMRILAAPMTDRSLLPIPFVSVIPPADGWSATTYVLPDGEGASDEQIAALRQLLGSAVGCSNLQGASLITPDGLVRVVYGSDYGYSVVIGLWQDDQAGLSEATPSGLAGQLLFNLYEIRVLDEQHVAAYIDRPEGTSFSDPSTGFGRVYYPKFDHRGYIVIEQQTDGQWLIDDLVYPSLVP